MKVLKFYTKSNKGKIERVIWYINDRTFRSNIIKKVEEFIRINGLICLMDTAQLYHNRKDFEAQEKSKINIPKCKMDYLFIGNE